MELIVECYSSYTYAQEPRAFVWRGRRHVVQAVERAWRAPEGPHFSVRTEEGDCFELAYDEAEDVWSVQAIQTKTHSKEDQR
ncbi:MAG: hypothetical protein FJ014_15305 [Chloroflexi bacterium]|nr:hypothetical protein [Chloroflexota bacterium]